MQDSSTENLWEGERRLQALQDITDTILAHAELEGLLRELLYRLRQILGVDTAAILLKDKNELVARAAAGLEEEVRAGVRVPMGGGFAGRIAATAQPVILDDVDHADVLNPILREKGIKAMMGVPLIVNAQVQGVLHVGSMRPRLFRNQEVRLLQLVADRAAIGIENARLYEAEKRRAESLDALNAVVTNIHAAVRIEEVMQAIAQVAQRLSGGGVSFAGFFRGRGEPNPTEYRQWEVAGAPRAAFEHLDRLHVTPLFAPTFEGTGSVRADDIREHPKFRGLPDGHIPVVSYLAVPVTSRSGQVLGAILLGHPERGRFDSHVQQHVESLARQAALALENALLYERERSTAETLQRSLLPEGFPAVPGVAMAARYVAGGAGLEVGGDWYDTLMLPGGEVALVIGDVVGKGVPAAAAMGQLRNALRAYAVQDGSPRGVVHLLNEIALQLQTPRMATLLYAVLDPSTWTLTYINAGHLPPLVIGRDGAVAELDVGRSVPLGVSSDAVFQEVASPFDPGSTLLLYTDGLVESRGVRLKDGIARLRHALLSTSSVEVDELLDGVLRAMLAGGRATDDVAVLAVRAESLSNRPLHLELPANRGSLRPMRQALRRWLHDSAIPDDDAMKILVAIGEAASNSIEHAYGPGEATFVVRGAVAAGEVRVEVEDSGQWRAPRGIGRGRGLTMMRALMDTVEIEKAEGGSIVSMSRLLRNRVEK
jgi:serine phosphatase RsbU (regulator of sigma subunit)/anti-sigma regulatory factor (Ser/Thr protein kinase)/putative methionine-R-sulfoxide reductase with GAF domain